MSIRENSLIYWMFTIFFNLKFSIIVLLWVAFKLCHHLPQSRAMETHTQIINNNQQRKIQYKNVILNSY